MIKIFIVSFLTLHIFANTLKLNSYAITHNSVYDVWNNDILFLNEGLKFELLSEDDKVIKVFYTFKSKKEFLSKLILKKDIVTIFPSKQNNLKFDQAGNVKFTFEDNNKIIKELNIIYLNTYSVSKQKSSNMTYAPNPKNIISNQRGTKDIAVYKDLMPKTVLVKTSNSIGAGVIVTKDKYILTNWHVIKDQDNITVAFKPKSKYKTIPSKNSFYKATVVKISKVKDLALLKILDKNILNEVKPIKLSNLDNINIGEDIFTIGHPENQLFTLDSGMISQIRDNYTWHTALSHKVSFIIQTKNSISGGNSGGPLVNENLELVGINTFSNIKGQNLNYAVSIFDIKEFLNNSHNDKIIKCTNNHIAYTILEVKKGLDTNGNKISTYFMDSNNNNIVDLVTIDVNNDGVYNYYLFDTNEDGKYDKKAYDKDGDGIIERTLIY